MQIKMLTEYRSGGMVYYKDNSYPVADGFGRRLVEGGFAEDVDGVVATGTRSSTPKRVKPDDLNIMMEG